MRRFGNSKSRRFKAYEFELRVIVPLQRAKTAEMDPNYEYDAPTYVDFETVRLGLEDDDGVDGWFGKHSMPLT